MVTTHSSVILYCTFAGVDNQKFYSDKKDVDGVAAIAKISDETEYEAREEVFANNREILQFQFRLDLFKSEICFLTMFIYLIQILSESDRKGVQVFLFQSRSSGWPFFLADMRVWFEEECAEKY